MAKEIERKFLVTGDGWRTAVLRRQRLRDGLLSHVEGRKIRVRFYDGRATLTVKGPRTGYSRDEFEYDIPPADAEQMLAAHCPHGVLEKTRHHVAFGGFEWTVDEFEGLLEGTVFAEIELPSEGADFARPPWLGREVTGLEEFRQVNMIRARRRAAAEAAAGRGGTQPMDDAIPIYCRQS
ncbi:CYTH domain-containing protein [Poseidonocella sp. HB161398]|uniref:CYTH domain-containing protein n=1 Tax=Poseidonocella sp. HB161398 TaxID=2320855 RepID=UPI0011091B7D|nr:CYTH domain-containing protein [Poseidonocella sp. HB161398]